MKKIIVLAVAVFFATGAIAAFAGQPSGCASGSEKSIFQIVSDSMAGPCKVAEKNKIKPIKEITVFQDISDGIKRGSAEAKGQSLRTR